MNSGARDPHLGEVELDVPVRTYDIDYAGIVSNIVYVRWLEDLRTTIFERHLSLQSLQSRGLIPVLVRTDIRYRRPIRLFDGPKGRIWVSGASKARWTLDAEFEVDGAIAASAHQECALIDEQTFRPVALPSDMRAVLQPWAPLPR